MSAGTRAYLDAGSGQPLHPAAREALDRVLDAGWADPTGLHHEGRRAAVLWDAARESVAAVLGARPDEVAFTSSGNAALRRGLAGLLAARARVSRRLVVGAVEQSPVLAMADHHEAAGGQVVRVGVDRFGRVDATALVEAAGGAAGGADGRAPAAAACLQAANHEVGTRQPVATVAERLARTGVPLLMDAGVALGHGPLPDGWAVATADAGSWAGPPGVGVLAVRHGTRWAPPGPADPGQDGRVPGPVAVPLVAAAAVALEAVTQDRAHRDRRLSALIERIRSAVPATVPDVEVHGDPVDRVPHVVTFSCLYVDGEALLAELDRDGVAVGSGSACASGTGVPSHVLLAMGALSQGNVRITLPSGVPVADVEAAVARLLGVLPAAVARVRERAGVTGW